MNKRNWKTSVIAALAIFLLAVLTYTTGTGGTFHYIENPLRDALGSKSVMQREPDTKIKIIKIDSKSLEAIGQFPWDRSVYAKLIDKLEQGKAKAIGLDVMIPEPSKDPKQDQALAEVMAKYKNIVLPVNFNFPAKQKANDMLEYDRIEVPTAAINAPQSQLAHVNVFPDNDDKVRRLIVGLPEKNGKVVEAFSVKLANFALDDEQKVRWDENERKWYRGSEVIPVNARNQVITQYYTSPRQEKDLKTGYDSFSFSDVLNDKVDARLFENDIVLIGPFTTGLQDEYMTPMSRAIKMFGVEIHANMVQTILENKFWSELAKPYGIVILALVVLLGAYLFERFKGKTSLFMFLGLMVLYMIVFIVANEALHTYIPIFYPLLAIILMYVWSIVSHYMAERRERSRVTGIFGRFVPKAVVDQMLATGEEVKLGGERMDISLIFVDIRGFTTLSEKLEPEQVIQFLNEYLDVCTKAIFKFNGTLDKFIGDGVMAIFGAPIRYDNHAEMAVRAALEMKKQTAMLEARLMEKLGFTVRFGVGINCGPAIVGNIGSEELRLDYTAIGDTVNLTARLESNAKPGEILISDNIYERVSHLFEIESMGEIKVKGKELPVTIYQVHAEKSD
ncbi:adenylate/guanylate cyclase domain-containing protein [Paenibacillus hemerocallicola]|uniref:Adenylate/guanylate cyclase domain-containing protein n=1 Tax=Paenibacillus hemerocallicola TaxID=1172614 RepID=A0A5C4TAY5_9BACL|nr:adenylate/guanylate cyclase domain-containing protein [Paenibacillus hemerocallicola]TNJ65770.1 adenylate/guanylate cyclase domain-containing protein [Paenibacillus hemerocallicola]